jgi:hypothetical protein
MGKGLGQEPTPLAPQQMRALDRRLRRWQLSPLGPKGPYRHARLG